MNTIIFTLQINEDDMVIFKRLAMPHITFIDLKKDLPMPILPFLTLPY